MKHLRTKAVPILILLVFGIALVLPVSAATEYITVTKYADNNYAQSVDSETLNVSQLQALSSIYSNGPVYMQGPTFDSNDPWGDGGQNMINYFEHNGTLVSDITDLVDGMSEGDELKIQASDGFSRYFGYDNVYEPDARQGDMIVAWWDSEMGFVPDYTYGMRLFFYTPPETYGPADSLNLTLRDMEASFDPWYRHNYSLIWPSAKGLSAKYVQYLKIYPPHRYDFNTTGDTDEWAYEGGINVNPPSSLCTPSTPMASTTGIADDDASSQTIDISSSGYYAAQRFNFSISETVTNIESISVSWVGCGWHDKSAYDGASLMIWDGSDYETLQSTTSPSEQTLSGLITSDISNYVNSGNVTVLVVQNGAATTRPDKSSHLSTDYVKLVVTHHHQN